MQPTTPAALYMDFPSGNSSCDWRPSNRETAICLPSADQSEHITPLETSNGAPPFKGTRDNVAPALLCSGTSSNSSPDREIPFKEAPLNPRARVSGLMELARKSRHVSD